MGNWNQFISAIEKINPLFKLRKAGDSKYFIIFILEQFHKELKKPLSQTQKATPLEPLNQYDQMNTLNWFFDDFQKKVSIISDSFLYFILSIKFLYFFFLNNQFNLYILIKYDIN